MGLMIETFGLTRKFANLTAVEDLSIQVRKGEILGFLGPNGAGKTTTIRILSGIIAPTKGHAVVAGIRTDKAAESLHEVIGLLTESPGFYQRLNATENLLYFAGFYDIDVHTQVDKYLKLMGLWQRRGDKLGTFSKGMKQRLALARALLHNPKVLFLDEPTAGLDPESAQEVRKLIRRLKEEGRTIFLSTHNLGEAESLCDRIGLFRTRLIALDSPKNLRNRLFQRQVLAGAILALLMSWFCAGIFLIATMWMGPANLLESVWNAQWLISLFLLVPLVSLLSFLLGLIASSKAHDAKSAQNIALVIVLPVLAIIGVQLTGFLVFTPVRLLIVSIAMGMVNLLVLRVAVRLFQRESIVVAWR